MEESYTRRLGVAKCKTVVHLRQINTIINQKMAQQHSSLYYYKFLILLVAIVAFFITDAFIGHMEISFIFVDIPLFAILLASIYVSFTRHLSYFFAAFVIAVAIFVLRLILYSNPNHPILNIAEYALLCLFCLFIAVIILLRVLSSKDMTADYIRGAICAYLLLGIAWAFLYTMLEILMPNSFHFTAKIIHSPDKLVPNFLYYSFVTYTTLGYGDITPITLPAKTFAYMEAITGQLYIAILIARLVGMYVAKQRVKPSQRDEL